jgi:hypothetical protein
MPAQKTKDAAKAMSALVFILLPFLIGIVGLSWLAESNVQHSQGL